MVSNQIASTLTAQLATTSCLWASLIVATALEVLVTEYFTGNDKVTDCEGMKDIMQDRLAFQYPVHLF